MTSATTGLPRVRVPVLSRTIVCSLVAFSSASLSLKRIPFSAPLPVPAMIAVGVARPRAQGQAMMRTATNRIMAGTNSPPRLHQRMKVKKAIPITPGTKTAATRSARAWIGALLPWASWTRRIIWARAVSLPTFVVLNLRRPSLLMVAPTTASPGPLSTGIGSPVNMDSSTAD